MDIYQGLERDHGVDQNLGLREDRLLSLCLVLRLVSLQSLYPRVEKKLYPGLYQGLALCQDLVQVVIGKEN